MASTLRPALSSVSHANLAALVELPQLATQRQLDGISNHLSFGESAFGRGKLFKHYMITLNPDAGIQRTLFQ